MRHLNNGTDHRHSKSCCDQSSPARRTIIRHSYTTDITLNRVSSYASWYLGTVFWYIGCYKKLVCLRPVEREYRRTDSPQCGHRHKPGFLSHFLRWTEFTQPRGSRPLSCGTWLKQATGRNIDTDSKTQWYLYENVWSNHRWPVDLQIGKSVPAQNGGLERSHGSRRSVGG